ncbi:MAG TPA: M23 family metallopeptidase [Nannocystaceae bacterium]|nr:M23 family metallopeptidase [Nannocystaceae bacterium]
MRRISFALVLAVLACSTDPPVDATPPAEPEPAAEPESIESPPPVALPAAVAEPAAAIAPSVDDALEAEAEAEVDADGWRRGEVGAGDSLSRILADAGVPASVATKVIDALATEEIDPTRIRAGERWALLLAADGALAAFEYSPSELRTVAVTPAADGGWSAIEREIETDVRVVELHGTVESSLWNAVTGAGGDAALVAMLVDVLASNVDFYTDTRKGDAFSVVIEQHEVDGKFVRYGRVLGAEYRGDAVGTVRGLWWTPPGREGAHFTPTGDALDRVLLKSPLKFVRVSSKFDPKRMHPVLHREKGHFGIDYAAPEGTPVWAAADGTITHRGPAGGAGNLVILTHDGGMQTLYMHLSKFAKNQKVGDRVKQKTVIGYVGSTGLSTGAHLHFGLKRGRKFVDPATVKSISRPGVPTKHRAKFKAETRDVLAKLDALAPGE